MRKHLGILMAAWLSMGAGYGGDPLSIAASNASAGGKFVLVEFISRTADHARVLDAAIYHDPRVIKALYDGYAVGNPARPGLTTVSLMTSAHSWRPVAAHPIRGMVRVAAEDYPEVIEAWHVTSLPTFIVIDERGAVLACHQGLPTASEFVVFLSSVAPLRISPAPVAVVPPAAATSFSAPVSRAVAVENMVTIPWNAPPQPVVVSSQPDRTSTQPSPASVMQPVEPALARSSSNVARNDRGSSTPSASASGVRQSEGELRRGGAREQTYHRSFTEATLWKIDLTGEPAETDIDLEILDAAGRSVELSEGPQASEHIELAVAAGEYTVRVFAFRDVANRVAFNLEESSRDLPADRVIPGVEKESLVEGEPANIELGEDRVTWLRFAASQPGRFRFKVDQAGVRGGTLSARVVAADGRLLGRARDEIVNVEIGSPGRVYLELTAGTGYPSGSVRVGVEKNTEVDMTRVVREIAPGDRIAGRVGGNAGIETLYRIRVPDAGVWRFNLKSAQSGVDIDMEVLKPSGELVERAESTEAEESLRLSLSSNDERYVRVYVYRSPSDVAFTLTLDRAGPDELPTGEEEGERSHEGEGSAEERPIPPADALRLADGQPVSSNVDQNGTVWYRVEPARDGLLAVFLDGGDGDQDIDLSIHHQDGERLEVSQSNGPREALLVRARRGEPFFVRVYAYGESRGGRYRVWFQATP